MATVYQAKFTGGLANSITQTITTTDSLHGNKPMTLTFYNSCPGSGWDVPLGTTVRLSAACYTALEAAVQGNHTVQLDGTQAGINLRDVIHSILT
jgi:hypothetical protein